MTAEEAIGYLSSFSWEQHAPGLDRIRALLAALGNPQRDLRFVHVAGTNGKGSTCAMVERILRCAGYRVGLNTSPHLLRFSERIRVNGEEISDRDLVELVEEIRPAAEAMEEHPTEFELITALAFCCFRRQRCDIVVLETGLGGALDASNVIEDPEAVVLTAMGLDHVGILGATLEEVAAAKAGIIQPGARVVSCGGCPEADQVFRRTCQDLGASLREVDEARLQVVQESLEGTTFTCAPYGTLHLPLLGHYQLQNAAVAIETVEALQERGWRIPVEAVRQGLSRVEWPGRLELLRRRPTVLLDGAHNAHGLRAALGSLCRLLPGERFVFVLGVLADKDVEEMLDLLVPLARAVFTLTPESPRALSAEDLAQKFRARGVPAEPCATPEEALPRAAAAAGREGTICCLGSLYLSASFRAAAGHLPNS